MAARKGFTPMQAQEFLRLHQIEGLSCQQIAQRYGTHKTTIAAWIRRIGGTVKPQAQAARDQWQDPAYRAKMRTFQAPKSDSQRIRLSAAMRHYHRWRKRDRKAPGCVRHPHAMKLTDDAWSLIRQMARKRSMTIGQYVEMLVQADAECSIELT